VRTHFRISAFSGGAVKDAKCLLGSIPNPLKILRTFANLLHIKRGSNRKERLNVSGRKRNVQIKFFVTREEENIILQKMALLKTENKSTYLRKMAIDGYIIQVDHTDIKENTAQLQRIGNNVNQIVKRMNQTGSLYMADVAEVKKLMK